MKNNFANVYERAGYYTLEYANAREVEKRAEIVLEWYKAYLYNIQGFIRTDADYDAEYLLFERIEEMLFDDFENEGEYYITYKPREKVADFYEQYYEQKDAISDAYQNSKKA